MKRILLTVILAAIISPFCGCESTTSAPVNLKTRKVKMHFYNSTDPIIDEALWEGTPVRGMTLEQLKKYRKRDNPYPPLKLDWRHSDGYEQWSRKFGLDGFIRIYTIENGILIEWMDVYPD